MRIDRQAWFWLGALALTLLALYALKGVLLPFVVGMILAYALNPVAETLVRWGLSRTLASALVIVLIVLVAALGALLLLPKVIGQMHQLIETLPATVARLRVLIEEIARERLGDRLGEAKAGFDKALAGLELDWSAIAPVVLGSLWSQGLALVNFVSLLLITPLVVFYLLVDWHAMLRTVDGWLPREHARTIRRLAGEVDTAIAAFIRGQGIVCLILGTYYGIALSLIGLRYGLLIGLATGVLAFVPFAGWALGLAVSAAIALVQAWPDLSLLYLVLAVYAAGMAVDSALLSPLIVGQRVGLHPLWLIFALFVLSYAMGLVGMLVAVPLAAAIAVLVRHALAVYVGSNVYLGPAGKSAAGIDGNDSKAT